MQLTNDFNFFLVEYEIYFYIRVGMNIIPYISGILAFFFSGRSTLIYMPEGLSQRIATPTGTPQGGRYAVNPLLKL